MAKTKKEVATLTKSDTGVTHVSSMDTVPDHLKGLGPAGMEGLSGSDFKLPRIKLLQALSPEIRTYQGKAVQGEFWHSAANLSLGSKFRMVPCIAGKRVILFRPRWDGGGILAFSANGKDWLTGGNSTFEVLANKDDKKRKVVWKTGKDVPSSKLTEWGSFDPENPQSQPAATLIYEYLCYLPAHPELSPCVLGMYRTALSNARNFNTRMLMLRKPTASVAVDVESKEEVDGSNAWHVPTFDMKGFVNKEIFETATKIAEGYKTYQADYSDAETGVAETTSAPTEY